jgi:hypothetical protein
MNSIGCGVAKQPLILGFVSTRSTPQTMAGADWVVDPCSVPASPASMRSIDRRCQAIFPRHGKVLIRSRARRHQVPLPPRTKIVVRSHPNRHLPLPWTTSPSNHQTSLAQNSNRIQALSELCQIKHRASRALQIC